MKEPELSKNELYLVDGIRIKVTPLNYTILKRYQKRAGKGKGASFIDEYAYEDYGHYGNLKALHSRLIDKEFQADLSIVAQGEIKEAILAMEKSIENIDKFKNEVIQSVSDMEARLMKLQEEKEEKSKLKTDK